MSGSGDSNDSHPLRLGTTVNPWGEIGATLLTGGERYYHLIDKRGGVSMIPGFEVERMYSEQQGGKQRDIE